MTDVLERLPDGYLACDREWRVTRLNRAARQWVAGIAIDPDALVGRDLWEAFPALAASGTAAALRRAREEGVASHVQECALVPGRWFDTHVFPADDGVALYARDVTAQRHAEERLRLLADAGRILGSSLDAREMLTAIARLALPTFADCCAIDVVLAEGGVERAAAAHVRPEKEALLIQSVERSAAPGERWATGALRAIEHGDTVVLREMTPAQLERLVPDPARRAIVARIGLRSLIAVPLRVGGQAVGAISFGISESDRRYDAEDVDVAEELGRRAGEALERARLYTGERQARAELARVLDSIRDAFVAIDRDFRFTYVNRRAAEMLRQPSATLIGRAVADVLPDVLETRFAYAAREALASNRAMRVEEMAGPNGNWIEARIYPTSDGISVFFQDVSDRRRAQHASELLAEAGHVLGASLDYENTMRAVAGLVVPRIADICLAFARDDSGAVRRLAVAASTERARERLEEIEHRFPIAPSDTLVPRVIHEGRTLAIADVSETVLRVAAVNDEHLALVRALGLTSVIVVPLRARREISGALLLATTGTRRRFDEADRRLAEQLAERIALAADNARLFAAERAARAEAEAANRAKMQFLATMSHELRTPLNAIAGYAELLLLGIHGPVTEAQRDAVRRVQRSGRHLLALINNVLNFARIEAGHLDLRIADVPMQALLANLEPLVEPQLAAKHLRYSCDAAPLAARGDAEKVQQILLNLLSNAIKFTDQGGAIALVCRDAGDAVRVEVRDTGIGVAADQLEAIFAPFVQLDRTLSSGHEGTGLGLAISRDLARAMGGELEVESTLGAGSTFALVLPRAGT